MGVVDKIGPNVHNLKIGDRVVASFQIACGKCEYCSQKLSSFCDRTNNSSSAFLHLLIGAIYDSDNEIAD